MIVIGVDVHKQSVTGVVVDEVGRMLDEKTVPVGSEQLLGWASALSEGRLWAVEDCRRSTRSLERRLLAAGEELVRVPPKLMAPERRSGKGRGRSDAIDALAVARAALREPELSRPRADEEPFRELKLLVDHRDAIVDERRRVHRRLRWHLHQLDPTCAVPLRMLARTSHLERVSRWLTRQEQELQVTLAREPVTRCRALDREVAELDRQHRVAITQARMHAPAGAYLANAPKARADAKRSAASNDSSSASSSTPSNQPRLDIGATLALANVPARPRSSVAERRGGGRRSPARRQSSRPPTRTSHSRCVRASGATAARMTTFGELSDLKVGPGEPSPRSQEP